LPAQVEQKKKGAVLYSAVRGMLRKTGSPLISGGGSQTKTSNLSEVVEAAQASAASDDTDMSLATYASEEQ
jgi:hypothetical protein